MTTNAPTAVKDNHFENLQNTLKQSQERELSNEELREALQQSLDLLQTMEASPEHNVLKKILCKAVNELYRLRVVSTVGFFQEYFQDLPVYETREECFEDLNRYYFKIFGESKYKDFQAFREALRME